MTFRLGFGAIMAPPGTYPIQEAEAELGLMTLGPPWPPPPFGSDEWIARFATLPLLHQPGAEWRYNTGAQVLGILLERASGQPLETFLRERLFEPLGMVDTSFSVPAEKQGRFTTAYMPDEAGVLDPPGGGGATAGHGQRGGHARVDARRPLEPSSPCCVAKGGHDGQPLLSPGAVEAMTRDHLSARAACLGNPLPRLARRLGLRHGGAGPVAGRAARAVGLRLERRHRHRLDHGPRLRPDGNPAVDAGDDLARAAGALVDFWQAAYGALAG